MYSLKDICKKIRVQIDELNILQLRKLQKENKEKLMKEQN